MLVSLLATILVLQPLGPTNDEAYAAIWNDLELNAWIGNGNTEVSLSWYAGHDLSHPPTLKINNLKCSTVGGSGFCQFDLIRTPDNAASSDDRAEVRRLTCKAIMVFRNDEGTSEWQVLHKPPIRHVGHSVTSMKCQGQPERAVEP